MADFRKMFLALIAGALLITTVATAQPFNCNATAVPTLARSEGIAEEMGDVLLSCRGSVPAGGILANIRLRLTANITSNPLNTGRTRTEASLILDEGADGFRGYGVTAGQQNVYQAARISDDEIEWTQVWLAAPGSPAFTTIRMTNVRGNVQSRGDFATIYASINIVSPTSVPVDNNLLVVADTRPGLTFSVDDQSYKNCEIPDPEDDVITLKFAEGFASSFRPVGDAEEDDNVPGGGYLSESGWNPGDSDGSTTGAQLVAGTLTGQSSIGQANQGTRLMARFKNVPDGVTLTAPGTVTTTEGMVLEIVEDFNTSGAGGEVTGDDYEIGSDGMLVYEVVSITSLSYGTAETVSIDISADFDIPGPLGSATVNGNFAPISTTYTMSGTAPEPRFVDKAVDAAALTIGPCRTILLFPYVTNQAGFDTGIAIANTTRDPLGTTAQAGTCQLNFYGNTNGAAGPAAQTSPEVGAGSHLAFMLSGGGGVFAYNGGFTACSSGACVAPLFQGYVIALCNFQYAHGFAYVSDVQNDPSGRTLGAMGYLALVIPDRLDGDRLPDHSARNAASNDGEQLGN